MICELKRTRNHTCDNVYTICIRVYLRSIRFCWGTRQCSSCSKCCSSKTYSCHRIGRTLFRWSSLFCSIMQSIGSSSSESQSSSDNSYIAHSWNSFDIGIYDRILWYGCHEYISTTIAVYLRIRRSSPYSKLRTIISQCNIYTL